MNYVISDICGNYQKFKELMDNVLIGDSDTLFLTFTSWGSMVTTQPSLVFPWPPSGVLTTRTISGE